MPVRIDYFNKCQCYEDVKEEYRRLSKKYHPDVNKAPDATRIMQDINAQFEKAFERLKNIHRTVKQDAATNTQNTQAKADPKQAQQSQYYTKETNETAQEFMNIINQVIHMQDCTVELIGRWIWISGNTKPYKDILKALHFTFAARKQAWNWHKEEDSTHNKYHIPLSKIREIYGSKKFGKEQEPELI